MEAIHVEWKSFTSVKDLVQNLEVARDDVDLLSISKTLEMSLQQLNIADINKSSATTIGAPHTMTSLNLPPRSPAILLQCVTETIPVIDMRQDFQ